jgi:hypothetical protein
MRKGEYGEHILYSCFVFIVHENRIMKLAEIVLRTGEWKMRENDGGGEPN